MIKHHYTTSYSFLYNNYRQKLAKIGKKYKRQIIYIGKMVFVCHNCKREFPTRRNLERHLAKKFKCLPQNSEQINMNDVSKDIPKDTTNDTSTIDLQKIIENLVNEVKTLKNEMTEMKKELDVVKSVKPIVNNIETVNMIVAYGKEDISFLTDQQKKDIVMLGMQSIPKYVETIHCNDEKPQNKNVYIPNRKSINKVK